MDGWKILRGIGTAYLVLYAGVWLYCHWPASDAPSFGMLEIARRRWSEDQAEHVEKSRVAMTWTHLTRATLGERWPLTVAEAYVGCSRDLPAFSVLIVIDAEPWALNGTTKGWARGGMYRLSVGGVQKTVRVSDKPESWWAVEPELVIGGVTGRKYIGPLFDAAKALGCLTP